MPTGLHPRTDPRYIRQVLLAEVGHDGQRKLAEAEVALVGLGGLGSTAAQFLVGAGIGTLHIVDSDAVEIGNIHRQPLYHTRDCGRPKAIVAAQRLKAINPDITIHAHTAMFDESNARGLVGSCRYIMDCCDTFEARHAINSWCVTAERIMISAAIRRYQSVLGVFAPTGHSQNDANHTSSPCYACVYPQAITNQTQNDCSELGILGPIAGLAASQQALALLRLILDIGENMIGQLVFTDWLTHQSYTVGVTRQPTCPTCRSS